MNEKKTFNDPFGEKKGIDLLINEDNVKEPELKPSKDPGYVSSNMKIRKDLRRKIYLLKSETGMTITKIYNMIIDDYFKNNPV